MKLRFRNKILFPALLLASSGLLQAQQAAPVQSNPAQGQLVAKSSSSPEEVFEQLLHRIATAYREMAVISPSDSAAIRDLRHQFARLAEEEEKAASTANAMAAYDARRLNRIRQCVTVAKAERHASYGDSAFRK